MLFESCLDSSLCIPWLRVSIEASCERGPQICLCPPRSGLTASCLHQHTLASEQLRTHLRNAPIILFVSFGQHKIFWPISTVDIIQESSSSFRELFILKRDFRYWVCDLLNCIHQIIFFELFTKCLQNRCYKLRRVRVQQRSLRLKIPPSSLLYFMCMTRIAALQSNFDFQLFVMKPVVLRT